jgi:hypothetical protein
MYICPVTSSICASVSVNGQCQLLIAFRIVIFSREQQHSVAAAVN